MASVDLPRAFGKYTLLACLGRGGMGEVYAAVVGGGVAGIEKRCVVKTLRALHADDRGYVNRFLDEARLAVRLSQRNICPVFDVGVVDDEHYLAMEMVRGRDLRSVCRRAAELRHALPLGVALHVLVEVLDGLDYAHRLTDDDGEPLHVVHRDVSPQNVMISFDGDVKLIDFGLAASTMKVEQTERNIVLGKLAYMAPEQLRGEKADARADVFATAVLACELLTGRRYYDGVERSQLARLVGRGTWVSPLLASLDDELRRILGAALASDRDQRTASAGLLAEQLRAWAHANGQHGDGAALRQLMRELFGAARMPWETSSATSPPPATSTSSTHAMIAPAARTLPPRGGAARRRAALLVVFVAAAIVVGLTLALAPPRAASTPTATPAPATTTTTTTPSTTTMPSTTTTATPPTATTLPSTTTTSSSTTTTTMPPTTTPAAKTAPPSARAVDDARVGQLRTLEGARAGGRPAELLGAIAGVCGRSFCKVTLDADLQRQALACLEACVDAVKRRRAPASR